KIYKDHTYRVVVEYRNPMDHPTPDGGMGALGGVFIPSGDQEWPEFDRRHPQYVADLRNTLEAP
ncbi:MAG: hypothetical protein GWM93_09835, partial [Gemmatimonadetes bacterium]|nr:hypothetical protein [Gemmatimonadota bacterium]NIT66962.1 hypothetical protein [Gemmatimonadota bacterium]NIW75642.1 hypothetical protein [Gemmatimonadota bacterium]NIY35539.1 hypothetical protein [Gemmatimonadota bacterium]